MAHLALGCPKRYQVRKDGGPVVRLELDPTEKFLLTVCGGSVVVWDGCRRRVVLGGCKVIETGRLTGATWSSNGDRIFAAADDGTVFGLQFIRKQNSVSANRGGEGWLRSMLQGDGRSLFSTQPQLQPQPQSQSQSQSQSNLQSQSQGAKYREQITLEKVAQCKLGTEDLGESLVLCLAASPTGILLGTSSGDIVSCTHDLEVRWRVHLPELLRTDDALRKMGVLEDEPDPGHAVKQIIEALDGDSAGGTVALDFRRELEMCGVVMGNGVAFLLSFPDGGISKPSALQTRWLRSGDVVSIALEHRRMIASLGMRNGSVDHLHIGYTPGDRCTEMKNLSLSSWHFDIAEIGAAAVMKWSRDGTAIAIAWQHRGVAVWSISGCRMVWTLRQVGGTIYSARSARRKLRENDPEWNPFALEGKVVTLEWGPRGYFLWSSELIPTAPDTSNITEMPLYRSGVLSNAYQSESTRKALVGYDRVMVLGCSDDYEREVLDWEQLLIPIEYIMHNWPPEFIAVNDQKTHVAVAAAKGVAVCTISTKRWRLFGDLSPEKHLRCCALAWFGKTLLIFNEILEERGCTRYELNFLTRDYNATPTAQPPVAIPAEPLLVDVRADGFLLVVCVNSLVYLYRLGEDRGRVSCKQCAKVILPTRESNSSAVSSKVPGGGISVARIFPPIDLLELDLDNKFNMPTKVMLVRSTGTLILLDMAKMMSIPLLKNVEQFWYTEASSKDGPPFNTYMTRPAFWAHGDEGVFVCFAPSFKRMLEEFLSGPRQRNADAFVEKWFEPDPEVYPLGVSSESGMMLGVTQRLEVDILGGADIGVPFFTINVKGQPALHRLLSHLLRTQEDDKLALQFAVSCVHLPQFVDSLEWLLFEAVSEEHAGAPPCSAVDVQDTKKLGRDYLGRVVRLLHYFGEYEDIVVRCARKMESKHWPKLFKEVGEPAALLEICYMSSRFRTAAYLLVILQEMRGHLSTLHHVVRLIERSVTTGCYDLAGDLRHFLANADAAVSALSSPRLRAPDRKDELIGLYTSIQAEKTHPVVMAAVVRQARKLLAEQQYRELAQLSLFLDFPLEAFLQHEKDSKVIDFRAAAELLYRQFRWKEPTVKEVENALQLKAVKPSPAVLPAKTSMLGKNNNVGGEQGQILNRAKLPAKVFQITDSAATASLVTSPEQAAKNMSRLELKFLLGASEAASTRADDLAALTGLMLLYLPRVTAALRRSPEIAEPFISFLNSSRSKAYVYLGEQLKPMLEQ